MTTLRQTALHLAPPNENLDEIRTGKPGMTTRSTRAVLGNLANNVPITRSQANKNGIVKPGRTLSKQKGMTTLQIPKEKDEKVKMAPVIKPPTKPSSVLEEEPMELDAPNDVEMSEATTVVPSAYSSNAVVIATDVEDIDKEDVGDPQLVVEMVNDIYAYLRHLERVQDVKENYLTAANSAITPKMRSVLIDWLVDVHQQFHLLQETLYLTVSLIDRFLQLTAGNIHRKMLQLVGVTAMFIASKYEEMYSPEIRDFVYITDNAYTQAQIRSMEVKMLQVLSFELGRPLPLHFLRRNSKAGFVDARIHTLAKYVMELSLIDYKFAHIPPSMLAAAALAYSLKVLDENCETDGKTFWTPTLVHYSNYTLDEIVPLIKELAKLVQKVTNAATDAKLMAVRKKYQDKKLLRIAKHPSLASTIAVKICEGILA